MATNIVAIRADEIRRGDIVVPSATETETVIFVRHETWVIVTVEGGEERMVPADFPVPVIRGA